MKKSLRSQYSPMAVTLEQWVLVHVHASYYKTAACKSITPPPFLALSPRRVGYPSGSVERMDVPLFLEGGGNFFVA
jgi:hypothetical protein